MEISRLTLGVGRGKLAAALAQLYRDVRGQGLSLEALALKTAQSHATEEEHARALDQLCRSAWTASWRCADRRPPRAPIMLMSSGWSSLQPFISAVPEMEDLADYCRAVEGFREVRPQARGDFNEQVQALDALVWDKELPWTRPASFSGSVCEAICA